MTKKKEGKVLEKKKKKKLSLSCQQNLWGEGIWLKVRLAVEKPSSCSRSRCIIIIITVVIIIAIRTVVRKKWQ